MTRIARNPTDAVDGFFIGKRYLIHDRDPLYTTGLKSCFEGGGDFAEDSKGKCVHTLVFVFLD